MTTEKTFEETYPNYPFAKLVKFALAVGRTIKKLGYDDRNPERHPDLFLEKALVRYPL